MIPGVIAGVLALKRQPVMQPEIMLMSIGGFYLRLLMGKKMHKIEKRPPAPRQMEEDTATKIPVADLEKPYRMKMRLKEVAGRLCKVSFDGEIISTVAADSKGELEVIIVPRSEGIKRLCVFIEGSKRPVFEETLNIESLS